MAYAIIGGMFVATLVTLFLPALYVTWFRIKGAIGEGRRAGACCRHLS